MNQRISTRAPSPATGTPAPVAPIATRHASWMPWTGRGRPATPEEEVAFVDGLLVLAEGRPATFRRSDVTAVMNALRCGLTVGELFEFAPGLRPERLHAAYCDLERRRYEAGLAWTTITVAGRIDVFLHHRGEAAKLVPALISRLDEVARSTPEEFDLVLLQLAAAVASAHAAARRIERVIAASPPDSERAIELGRVLYNPTSEGVTGRPDFLAHRVGALVPTRVAALLEETDDVAAPCTRGRLG